MVKSIESCEFKSMNFVPVYLTIDTLKTDLIKKKKKKGGVGKLITGSMIQFIF